MLDYEIIEAASKEELIKQFRKWVDKNPKTNILIQSIHSHVLPTLKGIRFYLMFVYVRQSNLMMGQPGIA